MHLFTRAARLRPGNTREGVAWAVGMAEKVNQITSLDVGLWTTMFSPGVGTLAWSTFVEHMSDLEDADAKLMVDDMFVSELDRGASFIVEGADDEVAQVLHGEIDPAARPQVVAVVRSELAPGGFVSGIEAGIEIARRSTAIGGLPTMFLVSTTGKYGGVGWVTGAPSLAELDAAEQRVNADPSFLGYVDEVAPTCFLPGITTQTIYTRIA